MPANENRAARSAWVSITRQPLFDENRRIWGYALVSPEAPESTAINVAASAYMGFRQILKKGQKILVAFDERGILDGLPYVLPPVLTAVQVDEAVFLNPAVPGILERLKADGYLVAVGGLNGGQTFRGLDQLADIIALPPVGANQTAAAALPPAVRDTHARILAHGVDDAVRFERCRQAGATLFEGAFFKPPDTVRLRRMTSNTASRRRLLQLIEAPDPDIAGLAEAIQSDVALSFRLLAYINTAAFGFLHNIKSIHHAMRLQEWPRLKAWLQVVLLNDDKQIVNDSDVPERAARRGKFMELVAQSHDFWGFDPESLHLLGLFSLLDTHLGIGMDELVALLPIENKLKSALRGDANNEYLPLLQLARCVEDIACEQVDIMMQRLNLDRHKVAMASKSASQWVDRLTSAPAENRK
jgi:EAL and modified HD-GYP domain-containing signal transduction protein